MITIIRRTFGLNYPFPVKPGAVKSSGVQVDAGSKVVG